MTLLWSEDLRFTGVLRGVRFAGLGEGVVDVRA